MYPLRFRACFDCFVQNIANLIMVIALKFQYIYSFSLLNIEMRYMREIRQLGYFWYDVFR